MPIDLTLPPTPAREVPDLAAAAAGQLVELTDGQQVVLLTVAVGQNGAATTATAVRVAWARDCTLPLGETLPLQSGVAPANGPLRILGAWYQPQGVPRAERVVREAIRRGFITRNSCGIPWPLATQWQLSEQAAGQIEKYLYEVARSTGVAFPFNDIAIAMRKMHIEVSLDQPGLLDIVPGETPGRSARTDEEMLSVWARELQRRVHACEIAWGAEIPASIPPT
jgi:hypothetical protein